MSRSFLSFDWLRARSASKHKAAPGPLPGRVLFTGAGGTLGRAILPRLADHALAWRLVDRTEDMPANEFNDRHVVDLGTDNAAHIFRDVDTVVHFAAQSKPAPASVLRRDNVEMVRWLLDNMVSAGVSRLVYASSMHVMGMYDRTTAIRPTDAPKPDGAYGESKLHAERLIQEACASHNLHALIMRIGDAESAASAAEPGNWLATDDLVKLVRIGLSQQLDGATLVHAVTPHRGDDMGQRNFAEATGMQWSKAPSYSDAMKRVPQWYGTDEVARRFRGGVFASGRADAEFGVSRDAGLDSDD